MCKRRHRLMRCSLLVLGILVLLVVGIEGIWPTYKVHFRPMFWYLPKADSEHIAPWAFEFITADEFGDFAVPDRYLNLLLVVVAPAPGLGEDFWRPAWGSITHSANRKRVILQLDTVPFRGVEIRRTTDALIVVLPDSTQLRAPLRAGEAVRLFEKAQAVHLLGQPCGKTIMSSLDDAVGPDAIELHAILARAREAAASRPTTTRVDHVAPVSGQ